MRWWPEEAALHMAGGVSPCQGAWGARRTEEWPARVPSGQFGASAKYLREQYVLLCMTKCRVDIEGQRGFLYKHSSWTFSRTSKV